MDVIATLIEINAYDPVAGAMVTGRITNRNDPRATTANGMEWLPILQTAPTVGTSVFNGAFTGAGQIDLGDFTITLADALGDAFTRLVWDGADIKIYAGSLAAGSTFPLVFRAVGNGAQRKGRLELQVSLTSRASLLDVNILTQSYAGTGQLEGDTGLKGTPKPWVFGSAKFCRPVLIDAVRQIYQVSAYGPVQDITNVFEGGQEITTFDGDKDLTTIMADTGPNGAKWWRNKTYGLIRLGRRPLYQLTCHVLGDNGAVTNGNALTKLGDIIARILSLTSTITISATSLTTLNTNVTQPFDDYYDSQATVNEVITNLLMSVGGYYTFNPSGQLIFGLVRFGTSTLNLDGLNRTEPTVLGINSLPTSAPVWYLRLGAAQCHFVHSASDMPAIIAQQGADIAKAQAAADSKNKTFPTSTTPPSGAIDGDLWPDSSVSPTTTRRYSASTNTWVATSNQITAAVQVPYSTGDSLEALKPSQANSDKTSSNTAAAISGQGAFATLNTAGYGSQYLTGFNVMATLANLPFGSQYLLESSGGASATLNNFKTILGVAASITGQGAFATTNTAAYGSSLLTGFGTLASLANLAFGSSYLLESSGGSSASLANFKTILGTAAGITGQAPAATDTTIQPGATKDVAISGRETTNDNPGYYFGTYPGRTVQERKNASAVGITTGASQDIGNLETIVGAVARQTFTAYSTARAWQRSHLDINSWSSWAEVYNQDRKPYFGSDLLEASGGTIATLSVFKTSLGISSGFTGQGSFATRNSINYNEVQDRWAGFTHYGSMTDGINVDMLRPQEVGSNVTERRTAAAFTGQGSFATLSNVSRGNYGNYFNLNAISFNYSVTRSDGSSVVTESLAITSLGISSGFTGQGALATKNKVGGNDFDVSYNGQGGRVERDGNGTRIYGNNGQLRVKTGF